MQTLEEKLRQKRGVGWFILLALVIPNTWWLLYYNRRYKKTLLRLFAAAAQTFLLFFVPQVPFLVFDPGQLRPAGLVTDLVIFPVYLALGQIAADRFVLWDFSGYKSAAFAKRWFIAGAVLNITALIIPIAVTVRALYWDLHLVSIVHFLAFQWFVMRLGCVYPISFDKKVPTTLRVIVGIAGALLLLFYLLGILEFIAMFR